MQLYFHKKLIVAAHVGAVLGYESDFAFYIRVNLTIFSKTFREKSYLVVAKSHSAEVCGYSILSIV